MQHLQSLNVTLWLVLINLSIESLETKLRISVYKNNFLSLFLVNVSHMVVQHSYHIGIGVVVQVNKNQFRQQWHQ